MVLIMAWSLWWDLGKILCDCKVYWWLSCASRSGGERLDQVVVVGGASGMQMTNSGGQQQMPTQWKMLAADTFAVVRAGAKANCGFTYICWALRWQCILPLQMLFMSICVQPQRPELLVFTHVTKEWSKIFEVLRENYCPRIPCSEKVSYKSERKQRLSQTNCERICCQYIWLAGNVTRISSEKKKII